MYPVKALRTSPLEDRSRWALLGHVHRNVWFLGLTSLVTDISSEMVTSVLPIYLVATLGMSPLGFGFIDGLQQGASALVRLVGGVLSDRSRRHREVAAGGYLLSAACKLGLVVAGSAWPMIAGVVFLDRVGKGVRTAPRDALITLSSAREHLGLAFGVHRALDTAGALLGPIVGFAILGLATQAFDALFIVSFLVALIGAGVLLTFVENAPTAVRAIDVSLTAALRLLRLAPFRRLTAVAGILSLATVSDGFFYLVLQRRVGLEPASFPLLYIGCALIYMVLAVPLGRLADRFGRRAVFVAGYAALLMAYAELAVPSAAWVCIALGLALLGVYYAATDGVLMAAASVLLPPQQQASGFAVLTTVTAVARLAASMLFGAAWSWRGPEAAIACFTVALGAALMIVVVASRGWGEQR